MIDWAELRKQNRLVVHQTFALPPAKYLAPGALSGSEIVVTVRFHPKEKRFGDLMQEGYAQVDEDITKLVFLQSEVTPKKRGIVTLSDGRRFSIGKEYPQDDSTVSVFEVEAMSSTAASDVDYSAQPYMANIKRDMRSVVHGVFALPATHVSSAGVETPVTVRRHDKAKVFGDIQHEGYAQTLLDITSLVFLTLEITPSRKDIIVFEDGQRFMLDLQHPQPDLDQVIWDVIAAPAPAAYVHAGYVQSGYVRMAA